MKFRPCIDLHKGKVKQIVGSSLTENCAVENFISDKTASFYAEMYRNDGLCGGHIIMLGPGNEDEALAALKTFPGGMQIGGGINPDNAGKYLNAGASHVIVTSFVFKNGIIDFDNLKTLTRKIGRDKLVIDLSCRIRAAEYFVVTDRWRNYTDFKINEGNINKLEHYCDEFLVHAVDVEGMKEGVDVNLVNLLAESVTIPVTYAGGVKDFNDITNVFNAGKGKIDLTVGSALDIFGGNLPYNEVIKREEFSLKYNEKFSQ